MLPRMRSFVTSSRRRVRAFALACLALSPACAPRSAPAPAAGLAPAPEHLARSLAALGFPGARRAFQVGPGARLWDGEHALVFAIPGEPAATVSPVWFESDGVPIAHVTVAGARESLAIEAACLPVAGADTALTLSVEVTATTRDGAPAALEVTLASGAEAPAFRAWSAPFVPGALTVRGGREVLDAAGTVIATLPEGADAATDRGQVHASLTRTPAAGTPARWTFTMPARGSTLAAHAAFAADARARWRALLAKGPALSSGDPEWDAMERAAHVTLLQCLERESGGLATIGSPFQYRDVWLRDGARALRALALCGHAAEAREAARTFLRFQWPSGEFLSQRGQLDGTGQALWALEQAASHPADAAFAREVLPAAMRAVRALRAQCEGTRAIGAPWPGLLPFGDPQDGELVRAPLVGNDAWAIAGEDAAGRLAALAGDAAAASECAGVARAHRDAFAAALARVRRADVPPSWPGAGRDWGNFAVAFPCGVLAPGDPRVQALLARTLEARPGLTTYGPADSLHGYLGADLAMTALLAGRGALARAYLDSLAAHSSSTRGQAELFSRADGGFGSNLPPHATSAASVVELVHALLACEQGDTLVLAAGLSPAAWAGGKLTGAVTRFGTLDLTYARPTPDRFEVRWRGVNAPVRLRVPEGFDVAALEGDPAHAAGADWIVAPAGSHTLTLRVRAREGAGR